MRKAGLIVGVCVLLVMGSALAENSAKHGTTNVVSVGTATARAGESFAVKVNITNADTLAGAQVPIFYRSETAQLICDSVSFAGSRVEKFMFHDVKLPMACSKCGAEYDKFNKPPKKADICDHEGCGGKVSPKDQVIYFSVIDNIDPKANVPSLYPGDGLLATIYFTAPKDTPPGKIKLTRGMIPHPTMSLVFSVWNTVGDDVDGEFREGEITIVK